MATRKVLRNKAHSRAVTECCGAAPPAVLRSCPAGGGAAGALTQCSVHTVHEDNSTAPHLLGISAALETAVARGSAGVEDPL